MNITILAIGKIKDRNLQALQEEYCKRLRAFCVPEVIEVRDEPETHPGREAEAVQIRDKEAERALSRIRPSDYVILLDLHGTEWTSEEFASRLSLWQQKSSSLVFVIAGSLGPGEKLIQRADVRWKLSSLTFTHLMTRVLTLEQIYRGFMIENGRNYHK